jgi:iron complex outermembrane recepter protein
VSNAVGAHLGAALRYVGDRLSSPTSSPTAVEADAYTAVDLNAALRFAERWRLTLYARNVTDEEAAITRSTSTGNAGFISVAPLQPRTFGLGVEVGF